MKTIALTLALSPCCGGGAAAAPPLDAAAAAAAAEAASGRRPLPRNAAAAARPRPPRGYGTGPVYPTGFSLSPDSRHPGWLASKTIWTWPTRLRDRHVRVLVRGLRLDRPGHVRFQLGPNWGSTPLTRELHLDTSRTVGSFSNSDWGTTVTLLFAHQPGCYGLQLDTTAGTNTIVIRLTRAPLTLAAPSPGFGSGHRAQAARRRLRPGRI